MTQATPLTWRVSSTANRYVADGDGIRYLVSGGAGAMMPWRVDVYRTAKRSIDGGLRGCEPGGPIWREHTLATLSDAQDWAQCFEASDPSKYPGRRAVEANSRFDATV